MGLISEIDTLMTTVKALGAITQDSNVKQEISTLIADAETLFGLVKKIESDLGDLAKAVEPTAQPLINKLMTSLQGK